METEEKQYAVSDCTGNYVFYTDDYQEALDRREEIELEQDERGEEGGVAIMKKNDGEPGYELFS